MLSGMRPADYNDRAWTALKYGMMRREELRYLETHVHVAAVITSGRIAAGADGGDSLRNALKSYKSAMFPEIETDLLAEAAKNEKILEQEVKRGPMKVQALSYETKRKKKSR